MKICLILKGNRYVRDAKVMVISKLKKKLRGQAKNKKLLFNAPCVIQKEK